VELSFLANTNTREAMVLAGRYSALHVVSIYLRDLASFPPACALAVMLAE